MDNWSSDNWSFRQLVFWTTGPLDNCFFFDNWKLDHWSFGQLVLWTLVSETSFVKDQLSKRPIVQKTSCPKDQLSKRPVVFLSLTGLAIVEVA